jgi:hypothetical protein
MAFLDKLRKILGGPPQVRAGSAEDAATLHEEFAAPDQGESDVRYMEDTGGGAYSTGIRYAESESAEAAEEDLESEEAPRNPDP